MAEWTPHILTSAGRKLQAKVETGTPLKLTRMKLGSGQETIEEADSLLDLVAAETDLSISSAEADGELCTVTGVLLTSSLNHGFYCREWGIFAQDPDIGEILYAVLIDEKPDWIPSNSPTELTITYCLNIAVANGSIISADVDPAGLVDVDMLHRYTHATVAETLLLTAHWYGLLSVSSSPRAMTEASSRQAKAASLLRKSQFPQADGKPELMTS